MSLWYQRVMVDGTFLRLEPARRVAVEIGYRQLKCLDPGFSLAHWIYNTSHTRIRRIVAALPIFYVCTGPDLREPWMFYTITRFGANSSADQAGTPPTITKPMLVKVRNHSLIPNPTASPTLLCRLPSLNSEPSHHAPPWANVHPPFQICFFLLRSELR